MCLCDTYIRVCVCVCVSLILLFLIYWNLFWKCICGYLSVCCQSCHWIMVSDGPTIERLSLWRPPCDDSIPPVHYCTAVKTSGSTSADRRHPTSSIPSFTSSVTLACSHFLSAPVGLTDQEVRLPWQLIHPWIVPYYHKLFGIQKNRNICQDKINFSKFLV